MRDMSCCGFTCCDCGYTTSDVVSHLVVGGCTVVFSHAVSVVAYLMIVVQLFVIVSAHLVFARIAFADKPCLWLRNLWSAPRHDGCDSGNYRYSSETGCTQPLKQFDRCSR